MKNEERWESIIQLVDQHGFLSVQELSELCNTSIITVRRDLTHLDQQNRLRRTHGGAVSLNVSSKGPVNPEHENVNQSKGSLFSRLDALITADYLPKFSSLLQSPTRKKRIPVIAESLPVPETETCVSVNNYQAGYDLGCWAGDYAKDHWDGQVNALDLTYHRSNTQARSQGFLDGLHSVIPSANLLLSINTQSRYEMAYQLTWDALSVHKAINIIFAINDISARGAYDACQDLKIPLDKLIILTFGVEGSEMIELILNGKWIRAGICMFPEIVATVCIEAAIAAFGHQALAPQLVTPYCIATAENITHFYEKSSSGWRLLWHNIPCDIQMPLPIDPRHPDRKRPLPQQIGFISTFIEHDWYRTLTQTMKDYTASLGICLEAMEFEQTLKDELHLRRIEIARRAAEEVKPGDTIFIDAGPISGDLAEQLSHHKNITVITNSLPVVECLKDSPGEITLISTGGAYRRTSQAFVGPTAETTLKEFRIDKLFLMVSGVSRGFGLSHTTISEVTIKQLMIRASREVILLVDHSCFQQEALIQVAPLTVVQKIITDDALPPSIRLDLGTLGISVILATM
jgi:DeoR family transcriptional regulator, fructose operon transcriptional repressor